MFRRRPAKRSPPGFARTREDITALGDTMGDMLTSPVREAPLVARAAPAMAREAALLPGLDPAPPRAEKPPIAEKPAARGKDASAARQDQWRAPRRG